MDKEEKKLQEKIYKELYEKHPIDEMVKFSELDLGEKLQQNTHYAVTYRDHYHRELDILEDLNDLMGKLKGVRYKYYRFEDDHEWTKQEIENFCFPSDEKIIQMQKIIRRQEIRVRFFEMAWKAFEKVQWNMKQFQETLKPY